jgi:hypothetical protein
MYEPMFRPVKRASINRGEGMDAQSVCWIIAIVLFVVDAVLAFRAWGQHMALLALGLAFTVMGFLAPTL